jgi:hypothetical protein
LLTSGGGSKAAAQLPHGPEPVDHKTSAFDMGKGQIMFSEHKLWMPHDVLKIKQNKLPNWA